MRILAFDTAAAACSAALWRDGAIAARKFEAMERGQSERLLPMLNEVLDAAGETFASLDLLAVTRGPGAFTGLRIGLAAARGLALAADLPCLGVSTLEAVAHAVPASQRTGDGLLVALDSKRDDIYTQTFDNDLRPLDEARAADPAELTLPHGVSHPVATGDAVGRLAGNFAVAEAAGLPDAAVIADLAAARWQLGGALPPPQPLYLRPPMATIPVAGGRLRP